MTQLTLNLPDEFHIQLLQTAQELKQSPEQTILLALSHWMQTNTLENAIEGLDRLADSQPLIDFPILEQELNLEIKFHPLAMEELQFFDEEDQIEILGEIIERVCADESEIEGSLDLVLKEDGDSQVILSGFDFGDVVYETGSSLNIYHIAIEDEENDEEENEEVEEDNSIISI